MSPLGDYRRINSMYIRMKQQAHMRRHADSWRARAIAEKHRMEMDAMLIAVAAIDLARQRAADASGARHGQ